MMRKVILSIFLVGIFFIDNTAQATSGVNSAATVICDVILLMRGRIVRAILILTAGGLVIGFITGNMSWQKIMMFTVGIGVYFGAETIAFVILPSQITGVSGTLANGVMFDPARKYTPQFIVQNVCPQLSTFGGRQQTQYIGGSEKIRGATPAKKL